MQRLAKAVPDCFEDAKELLEFAISLAKSSNAFTRANSSIIAMLKNASTGLLLLLSQKVAGHLC